MNEYFFEVKVIWMQCCQGDDENMAKESLKDTLEQEFSFVPNDNEITLVK